MEIKKSTVWAYLKKYHDITIFQKRKCYRSLKFFLQILCFQPILYPSFELG